MNQERQMSGETVTALTIAQRAMLALGSAEIEQKLTELAAKTVTIVTITNPAAYTQVHSARMSLKNQRVEIEKRAKVARDEANAFSKACIAEERRLIALISPEEERLQKLQKAHDDAKEAERIAKIEAERRRIADLNERIAELRGNRMLAPTSGAQLIAGHISDLDGIAVDDSFQEFRDQAEATKESGLVWLRELHAAAVAHESEQARLQAEREELARLRVEEEKRQAAERARIAEEERLAKAARDAEAARQAEELRLRREEQERADAEARKRREAEEAEHQERLRVQQAETDRIAREQKAARDAEVAAENERLLVQRETSERIQREMEEAQRRQAHALQEIQAINHQLIIANTGRSPYIVGRSRQGIETLIGETRAWPIDEATFGILTTAALAARDATIAGLQQKLTEVIQDEAFEADEARKAELARLAAIEKPADGELLGVLANHYSVPVEKVVDWILAMDLSFGAVAASAPTGDAA